MNGRHWSRRLALVLAVLALAAQPALAAVPAALAPGPIAAATPPIPSKHLSIRRRLEWNTAVGGLGVFISWLIRFGCQFNDACFQRFHAGRRDPVPHQFFTRKQPAFLRHGRPPGGGIQLANGVMRGWIKPPRSHGRRPAILELKNENDRAHPVFGGKIQRAAQSLVRVFEPVQISQLRDVADFFVGTDRPGANGFVLRRQIGQVEIHAEAHAHRD